jgi:hypothetical protein
MENLMKEESVTFLAHNLPPGKGDVRRLCQLISVWISTCSGQTATNVEEEGGLEHIYRRQYRPASNATHQCKSILFYFQSFETIYE